MPLLSLDFPVKFFPASRKAADLSDCLSEMAYLIFCPNDLAGQVFDELLLCLCRYLLL